MSELTGCAPGSDCPHGEGAGSVGAQRWMARVIVALRAKGLCAGQHVNGETDEIAVTLVCRDPWEGYHVANYGGGKVVWAPGAVRPSWTPASGCSTTPPDPPGGGGGPPPTLPPGACPVPREGHSIRWNFKGEARPRGWHLDATPRVCGQMDPAWGFTKCGTACCEIGIDGTGPHGEACQRELVDPPQWTGEFRPTDNPYTIFLDGPRATICASSGMGCGEYVKP